MQVDISWRSATKLILSMSCSAQSKHSTRAARKTGTSIKLLTSSGNLGSRLWLMAPAGAEGMLAPKFVTCKETHRAQRPSRKYRRALGAEAQARRAPRSALGLSGLYTLALRPQQTQGAGPWVTSWEPGTRPHLKSTALALVSSRSTALGPIPGGQPGPRLLMGARHLPAPLTEPGPSPRLLTGARHQAPSQEYSTSPHLLASSRSTAPGPTPGGKQLALASSWEHGTSPHLFNKNASRAQRLNCQWLWPQASSAGHAGTQRHRERGQSYVARMSNLGLHKHAAPAHYPSPPLPPHHLRPLLP